MGRRQKNKQAPPQPFAEPKQRQEKRGVKQQKPGAKPASAPAPAAKPVARQAPKAPVKETRGGKKAAKPVPAPVEEFDDDAEWDDEDIDEDVDEFDVEDDENEEGEEDEQVDEQDEDEQDHEGHDHEENFSADNVLSQLGLPKDGKKLTERQKKKLRAEAERLELLLKSSGYSLDDEEQQDEEGDEDEEEGAFDEEEDEEEGLEEGEDDEGGHQEDEDVDETLDDLPEDEFDDDEVELDGEELDDDDDDDDEELDDEALPPGADGSFLLPTVEEEEQEERAPLDLQLVQMRIREVANILGDLASLGEPGRSRADYLERFSKDVQTYYGYNEFLTNMFLELFSPDEAIEFFEANEVPRPVTIRANTLRTRRRDLAQKLINRGVSLEPVGAWSKVGLQVFESSVPIGATPEYLVGDYMLQAVSSFLPCIALAPQPGERVLDMASAPGGKVTYLSALMQNTGCVFANDSNKARIKSLTANVHRMGCRNVVVCNYDGRQFPKVMGGFDRVMLDSPCSGTGVISKDPSVKTNKSKRDFILLSQLQKQLILCAIDSVSPKSETGGYVVYSTCSVTIEENEEVVEYALRKRPNVRIVPTGIDFGRDGFKTFRGKKFDEKMPLCRRIFPHAHNLDGFFVCKLKIELPNKGAKRRQEAEEAEIDAEAERFMEPAPPVKQPRKTKAQAQAQAPEAKDASPFDANEDEEIMKRSRERMAKRRRT